MTEAQSIAAWLESPQAGLLGDARAQRAATLLRELERRVEQEQRFKYLANARADTAEAKLAVRPEENAMPPVVRGALRILLNHIEPGWENCHATVQAWLDGKLSVVSPLAARGLPASGLPTCVSTFCQTHETCLATGRCINATPVVSRV